MQSHEHRIRHTLAAQRIVALTSESQALTGYLRYTPADAQQAIRRRLTQIERALAHAQDERRRAAAGAPPAPRDYDPDAAMPHALLRPRHVEEVWAYRPDDSPPPPTARLTAAQVRAIRAAYAERKGKRGTLSALARTYNVGRSTILAIVQQRTWRDLDPHGDDEPR